MFACKDKDDVLHSGKTAQEAFENAESNGYLEGIASSKFYELKEVKVELAVVPEVKAPALPVIKAPVAKAKK